MTDYSRFSRRQLLTGVALAPFLDLVEPTFLPAPNRRATFVLVHGAWHGGWCWKKLTPLLRAAGHQVFTPTLTGLGDRAHLLNADVDLELHIKDLAALLEFEDLQNVTLVGHSYGGMVIAGVTDPLPTPAPVWC